MSRLELRGVTERAASLLQQHQQTLYRRTDRLFAGLMFLQWLAGIAAAYWIAPQTWIGTQGQINPTVWAAVLLGGFVSAFPIALALRQPGRKFTRHVIAAAQLMMSGLLIHFTGGRIETHFHIFGSLAFLAFYRDWPVLITASVVTAADHYLRGNFWPQSLYGVTSAQPWRWLEHSGWVVFTDIFLIYSIVQSRREMWDIACRRAETETADAALQEANDGLEIRVKERTVELTAMIRHNQLLLDAAGEGIYGLDADGRTTFLNPVASAMLGWEQSNLIGQSMHQMLHHTYPDGSPYPVSACPIYAALHDGTVHRVEDEVFWRQDGNRFAVGYTVTPIKQSGVVTGAVVTFQDISARKEAEQKIHALNAELEDRVRSITVLNLELGHSYDATIAGWSAALDLRDHETEGHSRRVTEMTVALAQAFGLSKEELLHVRRGALLHDIGKMGIPDAILLKPGTLTEEEFQVMRLHPTYAYEMLEGIPFVHPALDIPYCHHEKWDGTGYPRGLQGEEIPLSARLFAVVDVWDALRSDRPYRRAWPVEKIRAHIADLSGTHFDPRITDVFLRDIAPAPAPELLRAA
jgi:PAS domain S-box-containing protein